MGVLAEQLMVTGQELGLVLCSCASSPLVFEVSLYLPFLRYFSNHFSCQTRRCGKPLPIVPWKLLPRRGGKAAFQTGLVLVRHWDCICVLSATGLYTQRLKNSPGLVLGSETAFLD